MIEHIYIYIYNQSPVKLAHHTMIFAQSGEVVEYTDYFFAEG